MGGDTLDGKSAHNEQSNLENNPEKIPEKIPEKGHSEDKERKESFIADIGEV